jgi:hypothetical protein
MLHRELVMDYAQRMQLIKKQNRYPKAVTVCMDYIYDNLHTKMTLPVLAEVYQDGATALYRFRVNIDYRA